MQHQYYIYIVTNPEKVVLYTGITNNLARRLAEHWFNRGKDETFAGRYYCYNLIYYNCSNTLKMLLPGKKKSKDGKGKKNWT